MIQRVIEKHSVFQWLYLGMIVSFFLLDTSLHRLYFYLCFLPAFILFARWDVIRGITAQPFWRLCLCYLVYLWMTQFWSAGLDIDASFNQSRLLLLVLIFITATLYLIQRDEDFAERILRFFGWAGAIGAFAAVLYHLFVTGDLSVRLVGPGRAEHPIIGATLYGVAALSLIGTALRDRVPLNGKLLRWGAVLILIAAMLMTHSRGPALAMGGVLLVYLVAAGRWKLAAVLPLALIVYGCLLLLGVIEPGSWITRGSTHRVSIWLQTWQQISESAKSLLVGQGVANDYAFQLANGAEVKSPHNLFLANQLYGGVVAVLLLLGLLVVAMRRGFAAYLRSGNFVICAMVLFGLGVSVFDYRTVMINLGQEWVSFWIPVLLAARGWPSDPDPQLPGSSETN